jgi:hypothetical protein
MRTATNRFWLTQRLERHKRFVMRCDVISPSGRRCKTESEPAPSQGDLPLERFRDEGWFVAKVHGDICPKCLALGYEPRSEAYGFRATSIHKQEES